MRRKQWYVYMNEWCNEYKYNGRKGLQDVRWRYSKYIYNFIHRKNNNYKAFLMLSIITIRYVTFDIVIWWNIDAANRWMWLKLKSSFVCVFSCANFICSAYTLYFSCLSVALVSRTNLGGDCLDQHVFLHFVNTVSGCFLFL